MNNNQIKEIIIEGRIHLSKLKKIDLSYNLLEIINVEKYQEINRLLELNLSYNKLKDITFFKEIELKELKELYFHNNSIEDINISSLLLYNNNIVEINVLKEMPIEYLYYIDLSNNKIRSMRTLENLHFPILKVLKVSQNLIDFNLQKNIDILNNLRC